MNERRRTRARAPRGQCRADKLVPAFVEERLRCTLELSRAESLLESPQLFFYPGRYPGLAAKQLFGGVQGLGRLFGNRLRQCPRLFMQHIIFDYTIHQPDVERRR